MQAAKLFVKALESEGVTHVFGVPGEENLDLLEEGEHMALPDFGLKFGNPDFVELAEAYGAHGHRVGRADELLPLLARAGSTPGVHLIDVPIDDSNNHRALNVELRELCRLV